MKTQIGWVPAALAAVFVVGCGRAAAGDDVASDGELRSGRGQNIGFACRCESEGCRVDGLLELLGTHDTRSPDTIQLRTERAGGTGWDSASLVATESATEPFTPGMRGAKHFVDLTSDAAVNADSPARYLLGGAVAVEADLLAEGPEFDEDEFSTHRPFGFVALKTADGVEHDYSCEGLWRETHAE